MDTLSAPSRQKAHRKTALLVGILFLSSTATFAIGSSQLDVYFSGSHPITLLLTALALQVYTGLAVAGIGVALLPLLQRQNPQLARAYLVLRVLECSTIIAICAFMVLTKRQLEHDELLVYAFSGSSGMILSNLLYRSGLAPRLLAQLGMVGYVVLLFAIPTALLGLVDINVGWGTLFFVPGGLFELIFPLLLIFKGFQGVRAFYNSAR